MSSDDDQLGNNRREGCLAAVFDGPDQPLRLARVPVPRLADGETLVRIECCTVCGSDLHTLQGKRQTPTPTILGHEIVGRVMQSAGACDASGQPLEPGDRVVWNVVWSCGNCRNCQRGLTNKCDSLRKFGHATMESAWELSGGFAEWCHLPAGTQIVRVGDSIPPAVASSASCAAATAAAAIRSVRSFRSCGEIVDDTVLVLGAGLLGLTTIAMLHAAGCRSIAVCDQDKGRLAIASRFGADSVLHWQSETAAGNGHGGLEPLAQGYDAIFEMTGSPAAFEFGFQSLAIGGTLALVGSVFPSDPVSIPAEQIVRRLSRIVGVHNYVTLDLQNAVQFLDEHHDTYPFGELVNEIFELNAIHDAVEHAIHHRPIRVGVVPTYADVVACQLGSRSTAERQTFIDRVDFIDPTLTNESGAIMNDQQPTVANRIRKMFNQKGDSEYGGEAVTQLEHALQCALLAENAGASEPLIVAALVHDIGHLLHDLPDDAPDEGIDDHHERSGNAFLIDHFGLEVTEPVRLHVAAKRYLCTVDEDYESQLSPPSIVSLKLQGGKMSDAELAEFRQSPYWQEALELRKWDDLAKVENLQTPPLEHFIEMIERLTDSGTRPIAL